MSLTLCKHILERKGIVVSNNTISRRLAETGFRYRSPLMKPLLSSDHMKKRVEWCNRMSSMNWNSVIFTDETTVVLKKYKRKYWSISRSKKVIRVVKHPPKIHLWSCFSSKGFLIFSYYLIWDHIHDYGETQFPNASELTGPWIFFDFLKTEKNDFLNFYFKNLEI